MKNTMKNGRVEGKMKRLVSCSECGKQLDGASITRFDKKEGRYLNLCFSCDYKLTGELAVINYS